MGSSLLFHENLLEDAYNIETIPEKSDCSIDVWKDHPDLRGVIFYSVITPIICIFGICSNTLSLTVLRSKEMRGSIYTYLTVIVALDLLMSIVLLLGGLSRGILYYEGWAMYDALIGLPVSGMINSWSVLAICGVTMDRVLLLWKPVQCNKPRFCNEKQARKIMFFGCFVALFSNLPYCFIFTWDDKGQLKTSKFFRSRFYTVFNWFMLVAFDLIPAFILIVGNGFLITSLQKTRRLCLKTKNRDNRSLTITLISVTVAFLISEIPSSLVSRTKAVPVLFRGDPEKGNTKTLEVVRQISTLLGALNITMNFILYCLFCPAYCRVLAKILKRNSNPSETYKVHLFVLDGQAKKDNITRAEILQIAKRQTDTSSSLYNIYKENIFKLEMNSRGTEEAEYVDIIDDTKFTDLKALK